MVPQSEKHFESNLRGNPLDMKNYMAKLGDNGKWGFSVSVTHGRCPIKNMKLFYRTKSGILVSDWLCTPFDKIFLTRKWSPGRTELGSTVHNAFQTSEGYPQKPLAIIPLPWTIFPIIRYFMQKIISNPKNIKVLHSINVQHSWVRGSVNHLKKYYQIGNVVLWRKIMYRLPTDIPRDPLASDSIVTSVAFT